MTQKFYDLTPKISSRLAVFPGDQAFERKVLMSFGQGHHLDLSTVTTTVHLGAHADAPSHYHANGMTMEARSPARYMGLAQVVRVRGLQPRERIQPRHLTEAVRAPRVLVDTGSFLNPEVWSEDFNSFSPELLNGWADQGVKLVGIDTPSVDPADSKQLESHQVLWMRDLAVLEGLVLREVPEGLYTLIALPLPIEGGDASPVRAILIPQVEGFPELE